MQDEALVSLYSSILNVIEGSQWLSTALGLHSVNVSWSADSFGLSVGLQYIHRLNLVRRQLVQRADYRLKEVLASNKQLEFYWGFSWNSKSSFVSMAPYKQYSIPYSCGPDSLVCCRYDFWRESCNSFAWPWEKVFDPDPENPDYLPLVEQWRMKAGLFNTKHLLVLLGDDFRYNTENKWDRQINNYRKIFQFLRRNRHLGVNARFSTLSEYFANAENPSIDYINITGDFHPYIDRWNEYWSGFYSTRPWLKYFGKALERVVKGADLLLSYCLLQQRCAHERINSTALAKIRLILADFQHHDSITGTSRQFVINDLYKRLKHALRLGNQIIISLLEVFMNLKDAVVEEDISSKHHFFILLNILNLPMNYISSMQYFHPMRFSQFDKAVSSQSVKNLHNEKFSLWFETKLSLFGTYNLSLTANSTNTVKPLNVKNRVMTVLQNSKYLLTFSKCTVTSFQLRPSNGLSSAMFSTSTSLLNTYSSVPLKWISNKSGAYIFLHAGKKTAIQDTFSCSLIEGPLVSQYFSTSTNLNLTWTLFHTTGPQGEIVQLGVDFFHTVLDTDLVLILNTPIKNQGVFFTDSLGVGFIERRWNSKTSLPGNVYPITERVFIQDNHVRMTVHSAQPHGVTSSEEGEILIMLDRKHPLDDWRGLDEGVVDNKPSSAKFWILIEKGIDSGRQYPTQLSNLLSLLLMNPPLLLGHISNKSFKEPQSVFANPFPPGISLIAFHSDIAKKSSLLVLHRPTTNSCWNSTIYFKYSEILHSPSLFNIEQTNLGGTVVFRKVPVAEHVGIRFGDVLTFRITFIGKSNDTSAKQPNNLALQPF